jgi:DNA polymerase-4
VAGKTVHVTVRFADFTTIGRQETLPRTMNQSEEIYRCAIQILDSLDLSQPVRLLGVRITNLCYQREQLPLFEAERRQAFMVHAMDTVNNRYGDFTVTFGSLLAARDKGSHVISPAWRPSGIRSVAVT